MFKRYIVYALSLISLIWILFIGYDIINKENQFSIEYIFNERDGKILIINRIKDNSLKTISFETTKSNQDLLNTLVPWLKKDDKIIISEKRNHLFIESNTQWTDSKLETILKHANLRFEKVNLKNYIVKNHNITINYNTLYISKENYSKEKSSKSWTEFDENASASIIQFLKNDRKIFDYYIKNNHIIEYINEPYKKIKDTLINDQTLFAHVLPEDIEDYHFYEKNYFASIDKNFKKSPLHEWIDEGVVTFKYNGESVIVSDFKNEIEPLLVLNDLTNSNENDENSSYENIKLTDSFPTKKANTFHVKMMDDYVVISESKDICDEVVAQYRIGNTLSLNQNKLSEIYANSPQKISERIITNDKKITKTIRKNRKLTAIIENSKNQNNIKLEKLSKSIHISGNITDILTLDNIGNIIVFTESKEIIGYKNGKKSWSRTITGELIGKIKKINWGENERIQISTTNEVLILNENGKLENHFPFIYKNKATNEASFVKIKKDFCLSVANENGNIDIYTLKGKLLKSINTGLGSIRQPILFWTSKNNLYAGAFDSFNFVMIDVAKKKQHRKFSVPEKCFATINENEISFIGIENTKIIKIDQKGNKSEISEINNSSSFEIKNQNNNIYYTLRCSNELLFLDDSGNLLRKQKLNFGDLEDASILETDSQIFTSVVDGISNNVYVYSSENKEFKTFEGKQKTTLSSIDNEIILTTIVDEFIIQTVVY